MFYIMHSKADSSSILRVEPEIDWEYFELRQNVVTHEYINGISANPYMFEPVNDRGKSYKDDMWSRNRDWMPSQVVKKWLVSKIE